MAIRTLSWVVADDMSVTPTAIQKAGVQGDDKATCVEFTVPTALQEGYNLYIELTTAMGEYDKTDALALTDGKVSFLLPLEWTQDGGKAVLCLVAVEQTAEGVEPTTVHSEKGRIVFSERAMGFVRVQALLKSSIHRLMDTCQKIAKRVDEIVANFAENVKDTVAGKCYQIIERNRQVPLDMWVGSAEEYEADGAKRNNTFCAIVDEDNIWSVEEGGTGANNAEDALKNFGVADHTVEYGQKDGWTYFKKKSGFAMCFFNGPIRFDNENKNSTGIEGLYMAFVDVPMPISFIDTNFVPHADCRWHYTDFVQAQPGGENIVRIRKFGNGNSFNIENHYVYISVFGRWE